MLAVTRENYAIDFTGVADSTAGVQAALDDFIAGQYDVIEFSGFDPNDGGVIKCGAVTVNDPLDDIHVVIKSPRGLVWRPQGLTSGLAMFNVNLLADGSTVANPGTYRSAPHFTLDGFVVDGVNSTAATLVRAHQRGITLRNFVLYRMYRGVVPTVASGYSDMVRIEHGYAANGKIAGDSYVIETTYHGDGLVVDQLSCYQHGGVDLDRVAGGMIRACIGGYHRIKNSPDIVVDSGHFEMVATDQSWHITDSGVTFRDTFAWGAKTAGGARVVVIDDSDTVDGETGYRRKSRVLFDRVRFARQLTTASDVASADVHIKALSSASKVTFRDCDAPVFSQPVGSGARWIFESLAPRITSDDANIQAAIDAAPAASAGAHTAIQYLRGGWRFTDAVKPGLREMRFTDAPVWASDPAVTSSFIGDMPLATYYYRLAVVTPDGVSAAAAEKSIAVGTAARAVRMQVNTDFEPCTLRVWRGTSAGTYDRYVDVPLASRNVELFDLSDASFMGVAWRTTSIPAVPTATTLTPGWAIAAASGAWHKSPLPFLVADSITPSTAPTSIGLGTTETPVSTGGWPGSGVGVVTTRNNGNSSLSSQTFTDNANPPRRYSRRWDVGGAAWQSWALVLYGLTGSSTLDFGSIAAGATADLTFTLTGAAVGDAVSLGPPAGLEAGLVATAWVSATNTIKVRVANVTAGAIDPASGTWKVALVR